MRERYDKKVYAVFTKHCNLHCPHCFIRNDEDDGWNESLFMDQLRNFNGSIVLFGGEPTYHRERLMKVVADPVIFEKVYTISTNLINLDDELLSLYERIGSVGTSWNRSRFSPSEYRTWLDHVNLLEGRNIHSCVLVTLTPDLIEMEPSEFLKVVHEWNFNVFEYISLEYYVSEDNTESYYSKVDDWLCRLYKIWDKSIKCDLFVMDKSYCRCNGVYTLYPNGILRNGCYTSRINAVPEECYSCERVEYCKPCPLHKYCKWPKNLDSLRTS